MIMLCYYFFILLYCLLLFFFSSRRRHTSCALVTGVQTCALPISFSLVLRVFWISAIWAVTLRVASVPSRLPSCFWVRFAMVAMMSVPSVDRGPSPMTLKEADERRRHRSVSAGEPPCGVGGIRRAFAYKGGMNRGWSNVAVGGAKFVAKDRKRVGWEKGGLVGVVL